MTAALIFLASFIVVFALGVQQYNVTADRRGLAFITSLVIGTATLVQFKVLPGPTSWLDVAAYLLGSATGIVASMWAYPRLFKRRLKAATAHVPEPDEGATKLGQTLRLATTIADYAARSDIESYCMCLHVPVQQPDGPFSTKAYWDTADLRDGDALEQQYVANAVEYLHLRGHIVRHKQHSKLVSFTR